MTDLPDYLADTIAGIQAPQGEELPRESESTNAATPDPTDALDRINGWWRARSNSTPVPAWLEVTMGTGDPLADGIEAARSARMGGATVVIPDCAMPASRNATAVRAVIAVLTNKDASRLCWQPEGMLDADWMRQCEAVRDLSVKVSAHRGEPLGLLKAAGSPSLTFAAGVILGAASAGLPVLLAGPQALAAALLADRLAYKSKAWCALASSEEDPASMIAADRLLLDPLLDLRIAHDAHRGPAAVLALLAIA